MACKKQLSLCVRLVVEAIDAKPVVGFIVTSDILVIHSRLANCHEALLLRNLDILNNFALPDARIARLARLVRTIRSPDHKDLVMWYVFVLHKANCITTELCVMLISLA